MVHIITWPDHAHFRHDLSSTGAGLVLAMINLLTKFEVSISIHYDDMKRNTKCQKWGGLG